MLLGVLFVGFGALCVDGRAKTRRGVGDACAESGTEVVILFGLLFVERSAEIHFVGGVQIAGCGRQGLIGDGAGGEARRRRVVTALAVAQILLGVRLLLVAQDGAIRSLRGNLLASRGIARLGGVVAVDPVQERDIRVALAQRLGNVRSGVLEAHAI